MQSLVCRSGQSPSRRGYFVCYRPAPIERMADCGEPQEITALRTNLTSITDTVTVGGNLQWFANRLVEKAFIPRRVAQEILDVSGATPASKAGHLMDSVFVALGTTDERRRRFDEFVSIFSTDEAYAGLVSKCRRCLENKGADHQVADLSNQPEDPQLDSQPEDPQPTNSIFQPVTTPFPTSQPTTSPLPTQRSWTNTIKQWFNGLTQWFTSTSEGEGSSTPEGEGTSTPEGEGSEVTPAAPTPPSTPPATGSEESPAPSSSNTSSSLQPTPHNPSTLSFWSLEKVKATVQELEKTFGSLHAKAGNVLNSRENQGREFLEEFRSRLLLLPVRKATLHVKFFNANEDDILAAKNSKKVLAILCRFIDYRNYEILSYVVLTFCGTSLQQSMKDYCKMLEEFETATTVDVYLSAIPDEADEELLNGFSQMVVKIDKPESQCTLLDVRKLNKAIIKESTLCSHSVYIGAVSRNCVVVRLRFPSSAVGWVLAAITPDFMTTHRLTEVSVDGRQLSHVQAQSNTLVRKSTLHVAFFTRLLQHTHYSYFCSTE